LELEDLLRDPKYSAKRGRDTPEEATHTKGVDVGPRGPTHYLMHCQHEGRVSLLQKYKFSRGATILVEKDDVKAPGGKEGSVELTQYLKVFHIGPHS